MNANELREWLTAVWCADAITTFDDGVVLTANDEPVAVALFAPEITETK